MFHIYILYMHSKNDSKMLWLFRHSVKAQKFKLFNMLKYSGEFCIFVLFRFFGFLDILIYPLCDRYAIHIQTTFLVFDIHISNLSALCTTKYISPTSSLFYLYRTYIYSLFMFTYICSQVNIPTLVWWLKSGFHLTCSAYKRWCICRQIGVSLVYVSYLYFIHAL